MNLREIVLKALETARENKVIGKSLNAKVVVYPKQKWLSQMNDFHVNYAQVFIVSGFEIALDGFGAFKAEDISVDVFAKEGTTCERCWQVVDHVDEDGLCPRCSNILHQHV